MKGTSSPASSTCCLFPLMRCLCTQPLNGACGGGHLRNQVFFSGPCSASRKLRSSHVRKSEEEAYLVCLVAGTTSKRVPGLSIAVSRSFCDQDLRALLIPSHRSWRCHKAIIANGREREEERRIKGGHHLKGLAVVRSHVLGFFLWAGVCNLVRNNTFFHCCVAPHE